VQILRNTKASSKLQGFGQSSFASVESAPQVFSGRFHLTNTCGASSIRFNTWKCGVSSLALIARQAYLAMRRRLRLRHAMLLTLNIGFIIEHIDDEGYDSG
jgi:hypothetical protein